MRTSGIPNYYYFFLGALYPCSRGQSWKSSVEEGAHERIDRQGGLVRLLLAWLAHGAPAARGARGFLLVASSRVRFGHWRFLLGHGRDTKLPLLCYGSRRERRLAMAKGHLCFGYESSPIFMLVVVYFR